VSKVTDLREYTISELAAEWRVNAQTVKNVLREYDVPICSPYKGVPYGRFCEECRAGAKFFGPESARFRLSDIEQLLADHPELSGILKVGDKTAERIGRTTNRIKKVCRKIARDKITEDPELTITAVHDSEEVLDMFSQFNYTPVTYKTFCKWMNEEPRVPFKERGRPRNE